MRIGLVVPGFSADPSDWCIPAIRHLVRALAEQDEVHVIAVRYPYRAGRYGIDGADVIALGGAERRGLSTAAVWRSTLLALLAQHRGRGLDVLHAFWATESGLLAAVAGRLLHVPTIVSLAGGELINLPDIGYGDQRSPWERLKVSASLRLASLVTAGSRSLAALAASHVAHSRLQRAPLGVPLDLFHPAGGTASGADLVHAGTLTPVKDQATLLRAFARVHRQQPHACLQIVGDGPLRSSLEQLTESLDLKSAVRFIGDVDHAQLPELYRAASVVVLSSRHEAQGMVALEAAACGLAVAGTRVGVIPELARPDAVAEVGNVDTLAEAMLAAIARPAPPNIEAFSLQACTARFRELYAHLAEPDA